MALCLTNNEPFLPSDHVVLYGVALPPLQVAEGGISPLYRINECLEHATLL